MKTKISNFFVLVVIFLLGWFLVFFFLFRKQKPFLKFQIGGEKNTNTRKSAKKTSGVALLNLGLFSNDLPVQVE